MQIPKLKKFISFHLLSWSGWLNLFIFPFLIPHNKCFGTAGMLILALYGIPVCFYLLSFMSIVLELTVGYRIKNSFLLNNHLYSGFFFSGLILLYFPYLWGDINCKFSSYPLIILSILILITFFLNLFLPQKPTK